MADLSVTLGRLALKNPVLVASGTFGYAKEMAGVVDFAQVARRLAQRICETTGHVVTNARATAIRRDTNRAVVETTVGEFAAASVAWRSPRMLST